GNPPRDRDADADSGRVIPAVQSWIRATLFAAAGALVIAAFWTIPSPTPGHWFVLGWGTVEIPDAELIFSLWYLLLGTIATALIGLSLAAMPADPHLWQFPPHLGSSRARWI